MENIITIKNLNFRYENDFLFNNLNLDIKKGEWLSIVGPNGSGKSTLIKILVGLLDNDSNTLIDGFQLNKSNIMNIRKTIGVVFENPDNSFVAETVRDDMAFALENLQYKPKDIHQMINDIATKLNIEDLLEKDPKLLSGGEKQMVAIASSLIYNPKILILDEAMSFVDSYEKEEIINLLKQLNKEDNLTIINITHNLEDTYYGDRIVVLNKGSILIEGPTKKVLKEEKLFNRIGIEVPFMVDLSLKLNLYGLVDDIILDMDKMVVALWK
jgi:energy-coupling factor transport system ATP-binding protein